MAAIKFKPLEWGTYKALGQQEKLLAFDPFGNEFARIDLRGSEHPDQIEFDRKKIEKRYQEIMRGAIHTLRDQGPIFPSMAMWHMDMESAPRDGSVINVVARYEFATAGFPTYAVWREEEHGWFEISCNSPVRVIPWAWRPRDAWPHEPLQQGAA